MLNTRVNRQTPTNQRSRAHLRVLPASPQMVRRGIDRALSQVRHILRTCPYGSPVDGETVTHDSDLYGCTPEEYMAGLSSLVRSGEAYLRWRHGAVWAYAERLRDQRPDSEEYPT